MFILIIQSSYGRLMLANGLLSLHPNRRINTKLLKRSFLFQDKTYVTNSEHFIAAQRYEGLGNIGQADEIEMLIASNIIQCADEEFNINESLSLNSSNDELVTAYEAFKKAESELLNSMGLSVNRDKVCNLTFVGNQISKDMTSYIDKLESLKEHYLTRVLQARTSKQFFPLSGSKIITGVLPKIPAMKLEVLNYPMIDTDISWQRLLEFKQDETTKKHFVRFNRLLNRLLTSLNTTQEVYEEIEYMLSEYKEYVELAQMKYKKSKRVFYLKWTEAIIEGLAGTPLELLKPASVMLNSYLNIDRDHVEYLQAKHNAPEKEVSLLYEIQNLK